MIAAIEAVLESKIRPYLTSHGGDVKIHSYSGGVLSVELTGQCSGCPSAELSTRQFIAEEIYRELPEVQEVLLHTAVSGDLLDLARKILEHKI